MIGIVLLFCVYGLMGMYPFLLITVVISSDPLSELFKPCTLSNHRSACTNTTSSTANPETSSNNG